MEGPWNADRTPDPDTRGGGGSGGTKCKEVIAAEALSPSPSGPFSATAFNRICGRVQNSFSSGKSFQLPRWWDTGRSRFLKVKRDGATYAVLSGKTPYDVGYCFRVRRDEGQRKAFFTPVLASPAYVSGQAEMETLPDIVSLERTALRTAVKNIFAEAKHTVTSEELDKLVEEHAEEGLGYLTTLRALHPSVPLASTPQPSKQPPPIESDPAAALARNEVNSEDTFRPVGHPCPECRETMKEGSFQENEGIMRGTPQASCPLQTPQQQQQQRRRQLEDVSQGPKESTDSNGLCGITECMHGLLQEVKHLRQEFQTALMEKDYILNNNRYLQEGMETLLRERVDVSECVERLREEVAQLRERQVAVEEAFCEELSRSRREMPAEPAAGAGAQPVALEEVRESLNAQRESRRHVMQVLEKQQDLSRQMGNFAEALWASQEHTEKLLSTLERRDRQLVAMLAEATGLRQERRRLRENTSSLDGDGGAGNQGKTAGSEVSSQDSSQSESAHKAAAPHGAIPVKVDQAATGNSNNNTAGDAAAARKSFVHRHRQSPNLRAIHPVEWRHSRCPPASGDSPGGAESPPRLASARGLAGLPSQPRTRTTLHTSRPRSPYTALGYTNETFFHKHTPDRGVGLTILPCKRRQSSTGRGSRQRPSLKGRTEQLELHLLSQPPI
ncbi:uncharacterized protein Tco025E_06059 [Trypanosoma conorhini]|uniref:Uncharacterized protein n=1 Tax=Trypanosoma conorhini TaxID=83891 RepID=A0A3R7N6U7_9TRYP|nr:uncharacterized protein Tco025E_06059 [Trypanosoma conorhini]RNF13746.1 hypothetical protein Tco025E_06059 [Trypanosoma conorhini]